MVHLNDSERIEILMILGYGDRRRSYSEVVNIFNEIHPAREPISKSAVAKTFKRFRDTGGVRERPKSGRPKRVTNEENSLNVMLNLVENPKTSVRELALNNDMSRRSVQRILKSGKYHPYKIQLLQELSEDDFDRRTEFCEIMTERIDQNPNFLNSIVFSDESTFCLNGHVNRHNSRYWSDTNPHWMEETHTQRPGKVNVWCGIIGPHIIGPVFINGNLTSEKYLQMLREDIVPQIRRLFPNYNNGNIPAEQIWFQQDGAPPHFGQQVRAYLDQIFADRWIGRRGTIEWPARSPDLTPLDFFLWGYLKNRVYVNRPHNIEELKERIRLEINNIPANMLTNCLQNCVQRFYYCQEVNGEHFEHLL